MPSPKLLYPEIEVTVDVEDIPLRGNLVATGDDYLDRKVEDAVLQRLDVGDVWAWASVTVTGRLLTLSASSTLGGCSYASEEAFRRCPYFEDMVDEVIEDLQAQVDELRGCAVAKPWNLGD